MFKNKIFACLLLLLWISDTVSAQNNQEHYQPIARKIQELQTHTPLKKVLEHPFANIKREYLQTGILHDRVLSFHPETMQNLEGKPQTPAINFRQFADIYFELQNAALPPFESIALTELKQKISRHLQEKSSFPLLIANFEYETIAQDAFATGALRESATGQFEIESAVAKMAFQRHHLLMAAIPKSKIYHKQIEFQIAPEYFLGNSQTHLKNISIDFDDGSDWHASNIDQTHTIHYSSAGEKIVTVRGMLGDQPAQARFRFEIAQIILPEYTELPITAKLAYRGEFGSLTAYVVKSASPRSKNIKHPLVFLEGFDTDSITPTTTKNFPELWQIINEQNLATQLLDREFDLIIVNFKDGADFVQKNAFTVLQLLREIEDQSEFHGNTIVVGASMGGLVGRYALAYAEKYGLLHYTHTFVSFDSPHRGANIPLGVQEWLHYFAGDSRQAKEADAQLSTPAAKQMLALQRTDNFDHVYFYEELAKLGFPRQTKNLAIANGSGRGSGYNFQAGEKIVDWHFRHLCVDIDGHAYAISPGRIFYGWVDKLGFDNPKSTEIFGPAAAPSWDNAPGGGRNTMADIAGSKPRAKCGFVTIKLGDIKAPYAIHCFIPTISALDLATDDLFYPAEMNEITLAMTPFDDIFIPETNQEHVQITAENVAWILDKLDHMQLIGKNYEAEKGVTISAPVTIEMSQSSVLESAKLTLHAGEEIKLQGEFRAQSGSEFHAAIRR